MRKKFIFLLLLFIILVPVKVNADACSDEKTLSKGEPIPKVVIYIPNSNNNGYSQKTAVIEGYEKVNDLLKNLYPVCNNIPENFDYNRYIDYPKIEMTFKDFGWSTGEDREYTITFYILSNNIVKYNDEYDATDFSIGNTYNNNHINDYISKLYSENIKNDDNTKEEDNKEKDNTKEEPTKETAKDTKKEAKFEIGTVELLFLGLGLAIGVIITLLIKIKNNNNKNSNINKGNNL